MKLKIKISLIISIIMIMTISAAQDLNLIRSMFAVDNNIKNTYIEDNSYWCITQDGSIYVMGDNQYGKLGIGDKTNIKVVKNKVAPPFKTACVDIMYGEGISHVGELVDIGSEIGVVDKSGAWYAYNGEKIGQGKENVKAFLKVNPDIALEIEDKIYDHYGFEKKRVEKEDF